MADLQSARNSQDAKRNMHDAEAPVSKWAAPKTAASAKSPPAGEPEGAAADPLDGPPGDAADAPQAAPLDPELAAVVAAWPGLPDAVRTSIRALVELAKGRG